MKFLYFSFLKPLLWEKLKWVFKFWVNARLI